MKRFFETEKELAADLSHCQSEAASVKDRLSQPTPAASEAAISDQEAEHAGSDDEVAESEDVGGQGNESDHDDSEEEGGHDAESLVESSEDSEADE